MSPNLKLQGGLIQHDTTWSETHTIESGYNAMIAGPIDMTGTLNVAGTLIVYTEFDVSGASGEVNVTGDLDIR